MYDDLIFEFQQKLANIKSNQEPVTSEELSQELAAISEAMEVCERALIYASTSVEHREDVIVHLFEYKQLLRLQQQLNSLKTKLPSFQPQIPEPVQKKWWQF